MRDKNWHVIIIGGGAAGLSAAISIKNNDPETEVLLIEKNDAVGKKIRATGNGRCNLTNRQAENMNRAVDFFEKILGIPVIFDEQGRGYPFSESAAVVVDTLEKKLKENAVTVVTGEGVTAVEKNNNGDFIVKTATKKCRGKKVIIATGGKAGPAYGCSGDGFNFAKTLGHGVNKTLPILTGVECTDMPAELKGVRMKGEIKLSFDDEIIFAEKGEIQMTEYGLSGICVFNLSRHLKYRDDRKLLPYCIHFDCDPDHVCDDFIRKSSIPLKKCLFSMVKPAVADLIFVQSVSDEKNGVITALHDLRFYPINVKGFKMAQCTAGGVPFEEIDPETGESKICPGLFFAGEILDYDGPCGGFNLDHAWASGIRAASAVVSK